MNGIIPGRTLSRIKGKETGKFRREASEEDSLSLEPLYRYLPETPAQNSLQTAGDWAVRLFRNDGNIMIGN